MLSKRTGQVLGACTALVLLFLIVSFILNLNNTICEYDSAAKNEHCTTYGLPLFLLIKIREILDNSWTAIGTIATGLIAFFTFTLRQSTDKLWEATSTTAGFTRESIDLARQEFLSTHRPKIRIKHLWLDNDIWQEEPIIVNLICVNNGTTDAILHEVGIKYFVSKIERGLPIEPRIAAILKLQGQSLPCGRNWTTKGIREGRILTPKENSDIQQGFAKLYCVGYVSYFDAAERMRITGFCRILTFPNDISANRSISNCRFRVFDDPDYEYED